MTQDIALLQLPDDWDCGACWPRAQAYARACVEANVGQLRAEVAEWKRVASAQAELHGESEARAERLEEALRELARWEEGDSIIRKIALDALAESTNAATQPGETT
jgi:hypothetical protein